MSANEQQTQLALDPGLQKQIEAQEHRDRLAAIRLRLKSINPGPWIAVRGSDFQGENWLICDAGIFERDGEDGTALVTTQGVNASRLCSDSLSDAEFIAASRSDVPWLLNALDAAEATVARYKNAGRTAWAKRAVAEQKRADEAERQRDWLADRLAEKDCPHACPHEEAPLLEVCRECWVKQAAQKDGSV